MQDQSSAAAASYYQAMMVKQPEFPEQEQLKCPRCESTNTKFCYYNNYNLSQPRHYCKSCRRYWTKGGALRNIPVGGGSRKNTKRSKKTPVVRNPDPDPDRNSGSGSSRVSGQGLDPTRMMYGLPMGDQDVKGGVDLGGGFSSLLASNMQLGGIILDGSSWEPGLGLRRSNPGNGGGGGGDAWTDLAMNRVGNS